MQYLVQMKLVPQGRPTTPKEKAQRLIEQLVSPPWSCAGNCRTRRRFSLADQVSGAIGLALIVSAESAQQLDDVITGLPVWPRMETQVMPLTTFEGRAESLRPRLERLKEQSRRPR